MDDNKKKAEEVEIGLAAIAILAVIIVSWPRLAPYADGVLSSASKFLAGILPPADWGRALSALSSALYFLIGLSVPLSVFFLIGIVYCVEGLKILRRREADKHDIKLEPALAPAPAGGPDLSVRWAKVGSLVNSGNQSDWRQAILEADAMLDAILSGLGYRGESVGDKLKRVGPGEMKAVDDAWEAHKIRNRVAHEGTAFALSHHDAVAAVGRYRKVFEEFYYL